MAQNLQLLKRRIKTASNIAQIAKAMEMISASKIKKAQNAVLNNKPYTEKIITLTNNILRHTNLTKFKHPYIENVNAEGDLEQNSKRILIVITPDKGLCGSLNTNLYKKILEEDNSNTKIVALGKKATRFSQRLEAEIIADYSAGSSLPDYSIVYNLIEVINDNFLSGKVTKVDILYTGFTSIFSQEPTVKTLLPIKITHDESELPYILEPNEEEILSDLLPYYLEVYLYNSLLEAYTSEQAARMVAMQNAKNNALDIAEYLTLSYNKSRQERITNEILSLANNI